MSAGSSRQLTRQRTRGSWPPLNTNWQDYDSSIAQLVGFHPDDTRCAVRRLSVIGLLSNPSAQSGIVTSIRTKWGDRGNHVVATTGKAGETAITLATRGSGSGARGGIG